MMYDIVLYEFVFFFFFFFQAEDGIRDLTVTGVQTCALPIYRSAKWVAFHHGYTAEDTRGRLYNQLDRWSLRAAGRVITVCRPFADELQSGGVSPDRSHVQHMPIRPFEPVDPEQVTALRRQLASA